MAPSEHSHGAKSVSTSPVTVEQIIFSCDVCQAVVSDIYAKKDSDQGFSSGDGDGDGIVVRLWMGDCTHIFCGKHLDGGAVPFHPEDTGPRAQCPVCPASDGSRQLRDLFAIRGVNPGEYDNVIPHEWLICPPIKLDAEGPGMDALRFQYNRFLRYSRSVREAAKSAKSKQRSLEAALSKERKQWRKRESEVQKELEEHKVELDHVKKKLRKWDDRKDGIRHYMSVVVEMSRDLAAMRTLLGDLGVDFPLKEYAFHQPDHPAEGFKQSTAHLDSTHDINGQQKSSSSHKRKLSDYDPYKDQPRDDVYASHQSETDRMPPACSRAPPVLQRVSRSNLESSGPPQSLRPSRPAHNVGLLSQQIAHARPQEQSVQRQDLAAGTQNYGDLEAHDMAIEEAQYWKSTGYENSSARLSQRDLVSRIGNATLNSEAGRNHRGNDIRVPLENSHMPEDYILQTQLPTRALRQEEPAFADLKGQRPLATDFGSRAGASKVNHFGPSYRTIDQQSGKQAPRELAIPPPSTSSQKPFSTFTYQPRSPDRLRQADAPATSVISPFFKGNSTSSLASNTQRQYLDNDWRPDHGLQSRGGTLGRRKPDLRGAMGTMGPPPLYTRTSSPSRQVDKAHDRHADSQFMPPPSQLRRQLNGPSHIDRSYDNPPYINNNRSSPSRNTAQSQYSQRTHLVPPTNPFLRPASQSQRHRISLPPTQSLSSSYGRNYDPEVSQIRGVRGAGVPQYGSRPLFSAAGSRRSVRR